MLKKYKTKAMCILYYCLCNLSWSNAECVSLSGITPYPQFCMQAASNQHVFFEFKRAPIYQCIVETVTNQQGQEYLDVIINKYPDTVPLLDKLRENDLIGNPITHNYGNYGSFSATNLRYIKTACDLKHLFPDISQMHIVEIGGGFGGLCKVLSQMGGFASYTIIDLPEANALAEKYLSTLGVDNVHFIDNTDLSQIGAYDLVISNYAFSEIDRGEQQSYLDSVIKCTPNGYMIMNFISQHLGSISMEEFVRILYENKKIGKVEREHPSTNPYNLMVTWQAADATDTAAVRKSSALQQQGHAITYSFSGGRLGDNLLSYLHAKWFARKYNLPFFYAPFAHSECFCLSGFDEPLRSTAQFQNVVNIATESDLFGHNSPTLFVVPYYPEYRFEHNSSYLYWLQYFNVDWKGDREFRDEVRRCLTPIGSVNSIPLPKDRITVGVHIRRGGGIDPPPEAFSRYPLKFIQDSYYIEQIKRISDFFKNQPLYVYLFTDDLNPREIVRQYANTINSPFIQIDCRENNNGPHYNVVEDFCSMQKFDCLIISHSNFSLVPSKAADFALIFTPVHASYTGNQFTVDEVELNFNGMYALGGKS